MNLEEKILKNIEKIRKDKGISQDFVADKLGMKQPGYNLIEKGNRGLTLERLEQIAIIINESVIDIITYPERYTQQGITGSYTKVLVELELSNDEFLRFGLKDKVLKILNK